jgi:hypothetical protein
MCHVAGDRPGVRRSLVSLFPMKIRKRNCHPMAFDPSDVWRPSAESLRPELRDAAASPSVTTGR